LLISSACKEGLSFNFIVTANNDIPSIIVEIQIHTHAKVLASHLSETAIIIDNTKSNIPNHIIHHRSGC
jgi:hypothetical protein